VSPLNSSYKPEEIEKLTNTVVAKIFRKFPKTGKGISQTGDIVSK
jgi:hypothetical protein